MPRIVVAHPLAADELGAALDETVTVEDDAAARLIGDGFARLAGKKSRSTPTTDAPTGADNEGA